MNKNEITGKEIDKIFKETIEKWDGLASDISSVLFHAIETLNVVNDGYVGWDTGEYPDRRHAIVNLLLVGLKQVKEETDVLVESLSCASILKPIDELECAVIAATRTIREYLMVSICGASLMIRYCLCLSLHRK